ncbi:MAG: hypothetical protein V4501_01705 [Pseudomonadota bacterium]
MSSSQNIFTPLPEKDDLQTARDKIKSLYTLATLADQSNQQRESYLEQAQSLANSRFTREEQQAIYTEAVIEAQGMREVYRNSRTSKR